GVGVEVAGEHRPQRLLELVGADQRPTLAFELGEGGFLCGGEGFGVLQQRPPGTLVGFGDLLVRQRPGGLPRLAAHVVEGVGGEFHDMERILCGVTDYAAWWCPARGGGRGWPVEDSIIRRQRQSPVRKASRG